MNEILLTVYFIVLPRKRPRCNHKVAYCTDKASISLWNTSYCLTAMIWKCILKLWNTLRKHWWAHHTYLFKQPICLFVYIGDGFVGTLLSNYCKRLRWENQTIIE